MRRPFPSARLLVVALALCSCSQPHVHPAKTDRPDVSGTWRVTISSAGGTIAGMASFKQTGDEVTGWVGPDESNPIPIAGVLNVTRLTIRTLPQPGRTVAFDKCDVTVKAARMVGTIEGGDAHEGTIEFVRKTP